MANYYHLYLASRSPRRKQLLGFVNIPFTVKPAHIVEQALARCPVRKAREIAQQKALAVAASLASSTAKIKRKSSLKSALQPLIVAADTMVLLDRKILGIPASLKDAEKMLRKLSGRTHSVVTGMCLYLPGQDKLWVGHEISRVTFNKIGEDLLRPYLATRESLDKAGAYGIQGAALTFIAKVQGSYSNVVGFPLDKFIKALKEFLGLPSKNWQRFFK